MAMKWHDYLAIVLLTIGGLNWGLMGAFNFNLVAWALSSINWLWLERPIYGLVGLAGLDVIYSAIMGRFK